jgi:hypothetical protein
MVVRVGIQLVQWVAIFVTRASFTRRKADVRSDSAPMPRFLATRCGGQMIFVRTAAESAASDQLRGSLTVPSTSIAGKTTLPQLAVSMSLSTVAVTLTLDRCILVERLVPVVTVAPA